VTLAHADPKARKVPLVTLAQRETLAHAAPLAPKARKAHLALQALQVKLHNESLRTFSQTLALSLATLLW
jgi:hypothetical protein